MQNYVSKLVRNLGLAGLMLAVPAFAQETRGLPHKEGLYVGNDGRSCYVFHLGPEGGKNGGCIIAEGTPEEIIKIKESHTAYYLKKELTSYKKTPVHE